MTKILRSIFKSAFGIAAFLAIQVGCAYLVYLAWPWIRGAVVVVILLIILVMLIAALPELVLALAKLIERLLNRKLRILTNLIEKLETRAAIKTR